MGTCGAFSKRFLMVPLILVFMAVGVVGCGGEREDGASADAERLPVYRIADSTGDWGVPNPYTYYERGPGYIRMSLLFETLVWKDEEGFVPALAASWRYDEAENSYRFVLRDDVTWHDGQPFTAEDVIFTFEYMREHPMWMVDDSVVESVTVEGNELVFTLTRPYAPFLEWVAGAAPILPRHIWRDVDRPADFRAPESVVGTGPFKLGDYNKEQGTYLYLANDDYYGGDVKVGELRFVKVAEEMVAGALRNGEVNAGSVQPEVVTALEKEQYTVLSSLYTGIVKLMVNHKKDPLSRKEMRQALAYAIDCEELVEVAQKGHAEPGNAGYLPPDNEWFAPGVSQYPPDPSRAAALLEGLGYVKQGEGFARDGNPLEFELIYSAGSGPDSLARDAEMLKRQLEQAGFKINLRNMEAKTRDERVLGWDFDLALNSHGGLGGDPALINLGTLANTFNSARYEANAELVGLLEEQLGLMDIDRRRAAVRRVQELYAEELPALSLYYPQSYFAHDGKVDLYFTPGGVGSGVPIAINRLAFVRR